MELIRLRDDFGVIKGYLMWNGEDAIGFVGRCESANARNALLRVEDEKEPEWVAHRVQLVREVIRDDQGEPFYFHTRQAACAAIGRNRAQ